MRTEPQTARGMTLAPPRTAIALAAETYLLLFPAAHLLFLPVAGAVATAADAALLVLLMVWAVDLLARPGALGAMGRAWAGQSVPGLPTRRYLMGLGLLLALAVWVALSGVWGFHARYALVKGAGLLAFGLGAAGLATSGLGWRRAVDAWLGGTALALLLTLVLGLAGPAVLGDRIFLRGGGVLGLPFPRVSGPFLHPNMMGDYLVVSAALLWGRWPELTGRARTAALALGVALAVALFLTTSMAWVGAGVAAVWAGRGFARQGRRGTATALRVGGAALAGTTFVFLVLPLDVNVLGLELVTGGVRPAIWQASLYRFFESPLLGVGAAPYLAEAADPLLGGVVRPWDAHNAHLSVLGQFGVVGATLGGVGAWWAVTGALGRRRWEVPGASRARPALGLALLAVAVDALFMASEDLRHAWALMGMVGVASGEGE